MYSLFDTLMALCDENMTNINTFDEEYRRNKNILTQHDTDQITQRNTFYFDIERVADNDDNCLILACQGNTNLILIKYLIEDHKMNIGHMNRNHNYCLVVACEGNTNLRIIKYLIEECRMNIDKIPKVSYDKFKNIVLMMNNLSIYQDINKILLTGYDEYENDQMISLIKRINALRLNDQVRNLAGIQNPYEYKFIKFAKLVNELKYGLELKFTDKKVIHKKQYNDKQQFLFVHNKKPYYGDRNAVYGSIYVLNGILDQYDMTDHVVLEGSLPRLCDPSLY
jgi:hypothetical protein